tara:strand:- start:2339 stop:3619 length:1281 start_codon:yes stop_codon:yes gene_type:complete
MVIIKNLIIYSLFFSFCLPQGRMNALGIGHYNQFQGLNNAADGFMELTPSFQKEVSIGNPSTWHNLDYTYLSLSYSGDYSFMSQSSIANGYSSLSNAIWIVPIKSKYALGLSLKPYADQKIKLLDENSLSFVGYDTTHSYVRSFERSGGILSLNVGGTIMINEIIQLGYWHSALFGSTRQSESLSFGGSSMIQTARMRYNGIISNLYLSMPFSNKFKLFSKYTFTYKPLQAIIEKKHPFDDVNDNGYHDFVSPYFDFPFPDSVSSAPEIKYQNIHSPDGVSLGLNTSLNGRDFLSIELANNIDNFDVSKNGNIIYPIDNRVKSTRLIRLLFSHYPSDISARIVDKLSLKTGLCYYEHNLINNESDIIEIGFSLSIGYKFKPVGNQIDISYYLANREYSDMNGKELVQQIQLGIGLADIWFVKRRQK